MSLANIPTTGTANFESNMPGVLNTWKDALELKAAYNHDHPGESLAIITIADNMSYLGDGPRNGALGSITDDKKLHLWNETNDSWRTVGAGYLELEVFD